MVWIVATTCLVAASFIFGTKSTALFLLTEEVCESSLVVKFNIFCMQVKLKKVEILLEFSNRCGLCATPVRSQFV